jgi:hypothetical protein
VCTFLHTPVFTELEVPPLRNIAAAPGSKARARSN